MSLGAAAHGANGPTAANGAQRRERATGPTAANGSGAPNGANCPSANCPNGPMLTSARQKNAIAQRVSDAVRSQALYDHHKQVSIGQYSFGVTFFRAPFWR